MTTVYIGSFLDQSGLTEDVEYENEVNVWMRGILQKQICSSCGDLVFRHKNFIWWRGERDIFLCDECAEHTIGGMGRDLAELKGHTEAKGKTGELYNPLILKDEITRLQNLQIRNLKRIVELQNILARPS